MTDDECIEAYEELSRILESNELGWVAQEIAALVAAGKTEVREVAPVSAAEERDLLAQGRLEMPDVPVAARQSRGRGRAASFVATVDYPPAERLRVLIRGIRAATRDTADMELAIAKELSLGSVPTADLERPDGRDPWKISETEAQLRVTNARRLDAALKALESAI